MKLSRWADIAYRPLLQQPSLCLHSAQLTKSYTAAVKFPSVITLECFSKFPLEV